MANKRHISPAVLKKRLRRIGTLSRTGMEAGNNGDFEKAFLLMDDALSYAGELDKKCLEAKLLNNRGLLCTLQGRWDAALLDYDRSLGIVTAHYGTDNVLYRTLQKNMAYLFDHVAPVDPVVGFGRAR